MARLIVKNKDLNPLNSRCFNINDPNDLNGSISRMSCLSRMAYIFLACLAFPAFRAFLAC